MLGQFAAALREARDIERHEPGRYGFFRPPGSYRPR